MGLLEQQNVLARLYTDDAFRALFVADPQKYGEQNGLSDIEIEDINTILPDEIAAFAESLYFKRLREVEKLIPLTREKFGKKFEPLFEEFAKTYTPSGVKKHLEDAHEFCEFLIKTRVNVADGNEVVKFEQAKLEFYGYGKNLVIRRFGSGLDLGAANGKRFGLWLRIRKREFIF